MAGRSRKAGPPLKADPAEIHRTPEEEAVADSLRQYPQDGQAISHQQNIAKALFLRALAQLPKGTPLAKDIRHFLGTVPKW